jgi:hypothetical protein
MRQGECVAPPRHPPRQQKKHHSECRVQKKVSLSGATAAGTDTAGLTSLLPCKLPSRLREGSGGGQKKCTHMLKMASFFVRFGFGFGLVVEVLRSTEEVCGVRRVCWFTICSVLGWV